MAFSINPGVWPVMITPWTEDNKPDFKAIQQLCDWYVEKGCTGTTTADITGAAGIAQSSFFHVFPSKEALLLELVRRMFGGQFDLAGQHSGAADPVFLYAVEDGAFTFSCRSF